MFSIFPSVRAGSISPEPKVCLIKSWEAGALTASQFFSEVFRWYLPTGKLTARLFLAAALVRTLFPDAIPRRAFTIRLWHNRLTPRVSPRQAIFNLVIKRRQILDCDLRESIILILRYSRERDSRAASG